MLNIQSIYKHILTSQNLYMGVAIALIILYHTGYLPFYGGFVGVDIFLFLSGYRLCFSIKKYERLRDFYKKRFLRILPLFFILALCRSAIYFYVGECSLFDLICNITTLSYYNIGGHVFDWFLCAIILFYAVFPFLHSLVKKAPSIMLLISLIVSLVCLTQNLPWYYDTAIGRIPIFVLGIIFFHFGLSTKQLQRSLSLFGGAAIGCFVLYKLFYVHTYVLVYMLAPFIFCVISLLLMWAIKCFPLITRPLEYMGMYSLELYIGNNISMAISRLFPNDFLCIRYFALNVVLFVIVHLLSMWIYHTHRIVSSCPKE